MTDARSPSALRTGVVSVWACVVLAAHAPHAAGQVVDLPGGSSVAFRPEEASLHIVGPEYDASVGLGVHDGRLRLGATIRRRFPTFALSMGDETLPVGFSTDVFEGNGVFGARGVGIGLTRGPTKAFGFAGTTGAAYRTRPLQGMRPETVGALFVKRTVNRQLTVVSDILVAGKQTMVSGLEWSPLRGLRTAATAGVGANQPYLSSSLVADRPWVTFNAAYLRRGLELHRFNKHGAAASASVRDRVLVTFKPARKLSVTAGREREVVYDAGGEPERVTTVNRYATALSHGRFRAGGAILDSCAGGARGIGRRAAAGWVSGRVQVGAALSQSGLRTTTPATSWARGIVARPLDLLDLTNQPDQPGSSMSIGGELLAKRVTIGIGYRTMLISQADRRTPFAEELAVNVRVQPFGK